MGAIDDHPDRHRQGRSPHRKPRRPPPAFRGGREAKDRWRIGTEHEKFVYRQEDHRAPSYDEPGGIRDLLLAMTQFGWQPVEEGGKVIALAGPDGTVSLEPAGQLELSGAPLEHLHRPAPRPAAT
jgi:glutamate--cysteine ligase